MSFHTRLFPRYNVEKYKFKLLAFSDISQLKYLDELIFGKIYLENTSLGGIKIKSEKKFDFEKCEGLEISYGRKKLIISGRLVWDSVNSSGQYCIGLSLFFDKFDDFKHWLKFITALESFDQKKINKIESANLKFTN